MSGRPKRNGPANAGPFCIASARLSQGVRKTFASSRQDFRKSKQALLLAKYLPNTCQTLAKHLRNTCQTAPLCILPPAPLCAATPLRGCLPRLHRLQPPRLRHHTVRLRHHLTALLGHHHTARLRRWYGVTCAWWRGASLRDAPPAGTYFPAHSQPRRG